MSEHSQEAAVSQYDERGNAKHYQHDRINNILMMERVWGTYEVMVWCEMTAFKYRLRAGKKPGQPLEQELTKAGWYERAAAYFKEKIKSGVGVLMTPTETELQNPFK